MCNFKFSVTAESPMSTRNRMLLRVNWERANVMAGIAPLKSHLVKTSSNEQSQPSKTWNGGRHITGSALYSTLLLLQ